MWTHCISRSAKYGHHQSMHFLFSQEKKKCHLRFCNRNSFCNAL